MQRFGWRCLAFVMAALLLAPLTGAAQDNKTGSLAGTVKDAQGAVVPGAGVLATDEQTKAGFRTVSDGSGAWTLARIPVGTYTVTITARSTVTSVVKGIKVDSGATAQADATLQVGISENVTVTASKTEELLVNAPASVSIINERTIQAQPTQDYADLMRSIPGVNVMQVSARDFNITPRQASNIPAGSQLVMVDGRSVNQDYFGYVAWDFMPTSFIDIKQIDVLRGAASAVWGGNAMNGVVNIITKSPREMVGTTLTMGVGTFNRSGGLADSKTGTMLYVNASHAAVLSDRWAAKVSGGYFETDAFARPMGTIPNQYQTPYPTFKNFGTKQPKVDARVDYDSADGTRHLEFSAGYAATGGTFHTGLGPFRLNDGASSTYFKVDYRFSGWTVRSYLNLWHGVASSLLSVGPLGLPIINSFKDKTWDTTIEKTQLVGTTHLLSYGAEYRHNWTDLTMAPTAKSRDLFGAYFQDEMMLSDVVRWNVGARIDKFDSLSKAVLSPRTTLLIKPAADHTFRLSYSRAFRAPSLFQNHMDTAVVNRMNLGLLNPQMAGTFYYFPVKGLGSLDLLEQSLDSYEIGYAATIAQGRAHVGLTYYITNSRHDMILSQSTSYTSANPPPGWPLPTYVLDGLIAGNAFGPGMGLPSALMYQNLGEVRNKGIEANVDAQLTRHFSMYANYSWQAQPVPKDFPLSKINLPPTDRFNFGFAFDAKPIQGDVSVQYTSKAFFRDVLDATYAGWTKPFWVVNAGLSAHISGDNVVFGVKVRNLGNEPVQNHLFGDLLRRQIVAELRLRK